jgi:hypothetical protein
MTGSTEDGRGISAPDAVDLPGAAAGVPPRLRRQLVTVAIILVAVLAVEQLELTPPFALTRMLMQTQDAPNLILVAALLLALAAFAVPAAWSRWAERFAAGDALIVVAIVGAGLVAALGTRYVMLNTPLSHDEIMAQFDADIIASGRLLAPVPPEWRVFAPALKPAFRLPVPGDVAWASTYLPGNAGLRAILGKAFSSDLVNAVLVVAALLALLGIARQLWPQRRDAWVIAIMLAASSSQVLCMAMTPYAMSAHLALNLIWLWLFLRNTVFGHVSVVAIGFVATGLHQIVFHPLFVAPFLLQLLIERRWRLGAFYISCYAAIGLFWIVYWQLLLATNGIATEAARAVGLSFFLSRVASLLYYFSASGLETMVQNLLRFAAWQNPLLLVLLAPGMALAWRAGGVVRSLAAGIVLTVVAMFILLPYQDIGWGYRYVHGLIGSAALLAAFGWIGMTAAATPEQRRAAWGITAATTAAAVLVLLPIHAWQMHAMIAPYARAHTAIEKSGAGAVIIDTTGVYYGIELIRNDPYLRNRPLIFDIWVLDEPLVRELCTRMKVMIFDGTEAARYGVTKTDPTTNSEFARLDRLRKLAASDECRQLRRGG